MERLLPLCPGYPLFVLRVNSTCLRTWSLKLYNPPNKNKKWVSPEKSTQTGLNHPDQKGLDKYFPVGANTLSLPTSWGFNGCIDKPLSMGYHTYLYSPHTSLPIANGYSVYGTCTSILVWTALVTCGREQTIPSELQTSGIFFWKQAFWRESDRK